MPKKNRSGRSVGVFRRFFAALGPGFITGAADDDPSGIATYSVAGAQFGTGLLWTAFISWILMAPVQMMCARIGMVTGKGLAGALRRKFPKTVLGGIAVALLIANTINVGSDLSGMADAAGMLTGINSHFYVVIFGVVIAFATVRCRYAQISKALKWLALSLFAYVITALVLRPDWPSIIRASFIPTLPKEHAAWGMLVALLGTTISPYLFFWQASQEVEHEKSVGKRTLAGREGATKREIADRKLDVGTGTFFSNLVMYFIILTTALALHKHGLTDIKTTKQASQALVPFAGKFAATIFTVGIVGLGFLAIPTLTGASAYAFSELFRWRQGLDRNFRSAPQFYGIIVLSTLVGIGLDFAHVNPIQALYWTAVINGLIAPFLLVGIFLVACDRKIMKGQPSSLLGKTMVVLATIVMFGAAVAMFVF